LKVRAVGVQLFCEIRATPVTWLRLVVLEGRVAVLNLKPHHERVVRLLGVERYCAPGVRGVGRCVCTGSCKGAIPRAILGS